MPAVIRHYNRHYNSAQCTVHSTVHSTQYGSFSPVQAAEVESVIHSLIGVTSVVRAEHEMNIGEQIDKYTCVMGTHWCRWSGHTWRRGWRAGRRRRSRPWCRSWSSGPSCTPSGLRLHMVIMQNILNIDYAVKRKNIWLSCEPPRCQESVY